MSVSVDKHCGLDKSKVFQDYHCLLNMVEGKADKFYVIQLLTKNKDYYVWTRWGRNGTVGQSKLDGPTKQAGAEKNFKKKFQDKTKNKWEDRDSFVPFKGKYTLVKETSDKPSTAADSAQQKNVDILTSLEAEKPDFPDTVVSGVTLNAELLYQIMFHLSTKDVLTCMQVCSFWKEVLSEKYFWKAFICHHFDLTQKTDVKDERPYGDWSDSDEWYSYLEDKEDPYVMRPFPSMWKCGVIHPFGLDPLSGDMKNLQGFSRSLEILVDMKKGIDTFNLACRRECTGSEGENDICVVLFPWNEEQLPNEKNLIDGVFHFHPEVVEETLQFSDQEQALKHDKFIYHLPKPDDEESDDYEHDVEENPCLNSFFALGWSYEDGNSFEKVDKFYSWLQKIMVPSLTVYVGSEKYNPVTVFCLTKLAPGWVGGALTGVIYT